MGLPDIVMCDTAARAEEVDGERDAALEAFVLATVRTERERVRIRGPLGVSR